MFGNLFKSHSTIFEEFKKTYTSFDTRTLLEWQQGLENDLAFSDSNGYDSKMLELVRTELDRRKLSV